MSTPCSIIVPNGNKYRWIYVHWDGSPDWAGVTLYMHYTTEEKVQQLIALGGLSTLGTEIGAQIDFDSNVFDDHKNQCVAYHRDRGDDLEIHEANSLKEAACYGYAYLWQDGKWYYCYNGRKSNLFANKDFLRGLKREGVEVTKDMLPTGKNNVTSGKITININNKIRVKLTEHGKAILDREVAGTMNMLKNHNMLHFFDDYFPYSEDEAGYTEFQLWDFMRLFGNYLHNGAIQVIENNEILVEVN